MDQLFWAVVALDALAFAVLLVMTLNGPGGHDGGREMGVFFFVLVPVAVIGLAALLYVFSTGLAWKLLALAVAVGPGLYIMYGQVQGQLIDRRVVKRAQGSGYFKGAALQAMGEAVVKRDTSALRRIGPTVDVNAVGEGGMTLLGLAIEKAQEAQWAAARVASGAAETGLASTAGPGEPAEPAQASSTLSVVQTLVELGARPAVAMEAASTLGDLSILRELLDAGGDANMLAADGQPLVFSRVGILPLANLRLLAERGLDLDSSSRGDPLAVVLTIHRRHDLLAFLIEHGADVSRPRRDGRNVAGELASQMAEASAAGQAIAPDLLRAKALMDARLRPIGSR